MFQSLKEKNAVALFSKRALAPYPARFPTLSTVFYLFSWYINYGVQLGRSGTIPADGKEALISLYLLVLVGCIPFVFSGLAALILRLLPGRLFKRDFDNTLVKVNFILGGLLLVSAMAMMTR